MAIIKPPRCAKSWMRLIGRARQSLDVAGRIEHLDNECLLDQIAHQVDEVKVVARVKNRGHKIGSQQRGHFITY